MQNNWRNLSEVIGNFFVLARLVYNEFNEMTLKTLDNDIVNSLEEGKVQISGNIYIHILIIGSVYTLFVVFPRPSPRRHRKIHHQTTGFFPRLVLFAQLSFLTTKENRCYNIAVTGECLG